jgi:hypothetical protein
MCWCSIATVNHAKFMYCTVPQSNRWAKTTASKSVGHFMTFCSVFTDGLWPQYNYGGWPSCCRPTRFNINKVPVSNFIQNEMSEPLQVCHVSVINFDMLQILMLMPILEKYWPSLYCSSSSTCFGGRGPFWVHEVTGDFLDLVTGNNAYAKC